MPEEEHEISDLYNAAEQEALKRNKHPPPLSHFCGGALQSRGLARVGAKRQRVDLTPSE